jgi:hypothetical protein
MEEAVNTKDRAHKKEQRKPVKGSERKGGKKRSKGVSELIQKEMQSITQNLNQMESNFAKKIEGLEKKQRRMRTESKQKARAAKKRSSAKHKTPPERTLFLDPVTQKLFAPQIGRGIAQTPSSVMHTPLGNGGFLEMEERLRKTLHGEMNGMMDRKMRAQEIELKKCFDVKLQKFAKKCEK